MLLTFLLCVLYPMLSVCQVPLSEGKSVQQTISILHKKLEQLGAVKQEDLLWTVRLTMPQEMPGVTKVALQIYDIN